MYGPDTWKEAQMEMLTTFLRQIEATAMVWRRSKEGSGGYHQEDAEYADAGNEKGGSRNGGYKALGRI